MRPYGSDRVRALGARLILHSRLPKGWTPRREKQGTHAEFPGTTVLWDEEYFEVVAAEALPNGGVRYVLEPWNEAHTFRVVEEYSGESERRLLDDHVRAQKQRRGSLAARLSGVVLGNLPEDAQRRLSHEYGVSPSAMTLLSLVPSVILLGVCVFLSAGSILERDAIRLPGWLFLVAGYWFLESGVRFIVVMTQGRGIGSLAGGVVYLLLHPREAMTIPKELAAARSVEVPDDVAAQDRLTMRGPLLTLLSAAEQQRLADRYGFDHRQHAFGITWILLGGCAVGVVTSAATLRMDPRFSAMLSLFVAGFLLIEQIARLRALPHRPAPSVLGFVVRPFVRDLLEGV